MIKKNYGNYIKVRYISLMQRNEYDGKVYERLTLVEDARYSI